MIEEMKSSMSKLKMFGMLKTMDLRLTEAQEAGWSYSELLSALVLDEKSYRAQKSTEYKIKRAKFRGMASFDQFDYQSRRSIKKSQIEELKLLSFLKNRRNLLILGATGVGKTFLATAIGHHACQEGYTCQFTGINLFVEEASLHRTAGTFLKFRDRMIRPDLLILDDLGIKSLSSIAIQDLYDVLEERYQNKSTIITSQLPISNWKEVIDDEVALEAILDRVVYGQRIEIIGESYRKMNHVDMTKGDQ
jgi:DNA replication protein DnaC